VADRLVLGRYLLAAGAVRFAIEFIRINERVLWGLTVAHLVSLALMVAGVVLLSRPGAVAARPR
jgi:prolipoprotein diacylglyceryltransferase